LTAESEAWRAGHRVLAARLAAAPALVRAVLAAPAPVLPWHPGRVRRVVATGVGASAAHARLLVALLEEVGLAARFLPLTSFVARTADDAAGDALVVFSQGLSPNARLALAHAERFAAALVVTAVPPAGEASRTAAPVGVAGHEAMPTPRASSTDATVDGDAPPVDGDAPPAGADAPPSGALADRQRLLDELGARGIAVQRVPAAEEYGTLLRVCGPLVGAAAAIVLARALAAGAGRAPCGLLASDASADEVQRRLEDALARADDVHATFDARALASGCAFLASGVYGELLGNVQATVQEGLLVAAPPVWDLLGFAHGPFQEIAARDATVLALARADAPGEAELLGRVQTMLVPGRHRLVRLRATLPGALALLEHQALVGALVLRAIAERRVDQVDFPGRGADGALYGVAALADAAHAASPARTRQSPARASGTRLADVAWPDVERLRAEGCTTAILPLGSTEQHGPHLPFATDTLIAEAVAARVAQRLGGALCLPALPLGCADEHLGFPGTLSLAEETLHGLIRDTGRTLARHGFARLLVFTAHGGNYGALRAAAPALARALAPLRLDVFLDAARLTRRLEAVAHAHRVAPGAAGQHAGEIETSILLGLVPGLVRRERMTAGLVDPPLPPDRLFYPDLRRHAADGTVGDPRDATAARAAAYLDAWADVLAASWSAPDAK
jgi:creatinine amidohydrolase